MVSLGSQPPRDTLLSAAYKISEAETVRDLADALPAIRSHFGAESVVYRWDPHRPVALCGALGDITEYPEEIVGLDPQVDYLARHAHERAVINLTPSTGRARVRKSEAYTLCYRPNAVDEMMSVNFTRRSPVSPGHLSLGLGRVRPYSEQDEADAGRLLPFLSAFDRRVDRLRRLGLTALALAQVVELRSAHPILVATSRGRIVWRSRAAQRYLELANGTDAALPSPILDAIRRLSHTPGRRGPHSSQTFSVGCRRLAFDLQRLSRDEEPELILVELMPEAQRPLTPAERQVVTLLEKGVTLRDAAVALCVSLETVRTHTRSIYRKYGVSSRAELLAARRL